MLNEENVTYFTVEKTGEGRLTEKMSRFLSFAFPVNAPETARDIIKKVTNEYHDARHVCWAYMLGETRDRYQLNDNGEPSGTAGKPILGQINSIKLTNVLVVVVRYFGGIKLGTPGLIAAYREAARLALLDAGKKEVSRTETVSVSYPYSSIDKVMRLIKENELTVTNQLLDNDCSMTLELPLSQYDMLIKRLQNVDGLIFN